MSLLERLLLGRLELLWVEARVMLLFFDLAAIELLCGRRPILLLVIEHLLGLGHL